MAKNINKTNAYQTKSGHFTIVPSILFVLAVITYIVSTFLPWNPYGNYNLYSSTAVTNGMTIFIVSVTAVLGVLALLQFINCFIKKNWIRIITGIFGIIVSLIPWLSFLGAFLMYGHFGFGVYVAIAGLVLTFVFSIVLLATNKRKK